MNTPNAPWPALPTVRCVTEEVSRLSPETLAECAAAKRRMAQKNPDELASELGISVGAVLDGSYLTNLQAERNDLRDRMILDES